MTRSRSKSVAREIVSPRSWLVFAAVGLGWAVLAGAAPSTPLPTKTGEVFVVDDFDHKVTAADVGFNAFSGNVGATEAATGIVTLAHSALSSGREGGSLEIAFDFTGQEPEAFAGLFMSLFGLTDTLVSFDGQEPSEPTPFPGYFLDTRDLFRDSLAFPDSSVEDLRLDLRLESATNVVLKIELKDENGFDVFTRRTLSSNGGWQTFMLRMPGDFDDSATGQGDLSGFDWRRVSLLTLLVERRNVAGGIENPDTGRFLVDNVALIDVDGQYPDLDADELLDSEGGLQEDFVDAFLAHVRRLSFQYFLDFASTDSRTGAMIQDRSTFADLMSLGGAGFQLTAYVIAAERGYLARENAAQRVRDVLRALHDLPQGEQPTGTLGYRGFFYHFVGIDGLRKKNFDFAATPVDESLNTVELSTIDTALALAGVVTAGQYFRGSSPLEEELRQLAGAIYARVEWPFLLDAQSCQFYLGWKPDETRDDESGRFGRFLIDDADGLGQYSSKNVDGQELPATLDFYTDEALLVALLALGSPDPAMRPDRCVWDAIVRDTGGGAFVKTFPGALFTYQFLSVWVDTQSLGSDNHPVPLDLFANTRAAIAAVRDYVRSNPLGRATWTAPEDEALWGLSAAQGPFDTYFAHGAPSAALATDGGSVPGISLEREAENGRGDGSPMSRSNASGSQTVLLLATESHTLDFTSPYTGDGHLSVRYSNDNFGSLETVALRLDGQLIGSFPAQDTGDFGLGWNQFSNSPQFGPLDLAPGPHSLVISVSGGDGFGVEIDQARFESADVTRPLETGTVTNYAAGSSLLHEPEASVAALWRAVRLGLLHPRFGFADAFNFDVADALLPGAEAFRTNGFWAAFDGFAIDHGPMMIIIDNDLEDNFVPRLFMSHPQLRAALQGLFPGADLDPVRLSEISGLIVPGFEVEVGESTGPTTFFSIRNTTDSSIDVEIEYYAEKVGSVPLRSDTAKLGPQETRQLDVRQNISGLPITNGIASGLIVVTEADQQKAPRLQGDYFHVDFANDFATGERLVRPEDFCLRQEVRFVDFGSGSQLRVLLEQPQGQGLTSFTYVAYNQDGETVGSGELSTSDHFNVIDVSELVVDESFGTVLFDFSASGGGWVSARYSAFGRFSVELNAACRDE